MQKFTYFCFFLVAFLASQAIMAQTNYRSFTSGDWSAAGTWEIETSPGVWGPAAAAPTSADGTIAIRNGHNVTVGLATATADQLTVETGGTLTLNNTLTINDGAGTDLENDGTVILNSTLAAGAGTPTVQNDATFNWIGGTLSVPTTNTVTGVVNMNTANKTLTTTLTNDGTVNWSSNQISFNNGIINNNAMFNVTGDNPFVSGAGTNSFNNSATGIFTKSAGPGTTTITIPVTNAGSFNMNSGTVLSTNATSRFVNTGTLNFGGGTLTLAGTLAGNNQLDPGTVISGTGTFNLFSVTSVDVALAPPSTISLGFGGVALGGNLIIGTGSITVNGTLDWSTGRLGVPMTIAATGVMTSTNGKDLAANLTNDGIINLTDPVNGSIDFEGITFTNNGTINVNYSTNNRVFSSGAAGNSFVNNGVVNKTSNAFLFTFNAGVPVTNTGTFQGIGTYVFNGGITNTGTVSPGTPTSAGSLTTNNAIFSATSDVEIELFDANNPGVGHDVLNISNGGVTTLNGTVTIVDDVALPNSPLGVYTIMTTAGTFGGTLTLVAPSNFTNLTINANTVTVEKIALFPLPLVWGKFEAISRNGRVQLTWSTLEELNTSHFVVEHSINGREYTAIGTVAAAGQSDNTNEYSFWHAEPNTSKLNYYRLQQVDLDGKSSHSAIRTVKFKNGNVTPVTATPNPIKNELQLTVQLSDIKLVLNNASGAALRTYQVNPGTHKVNVDNLPSGIYFLSVYQGDEKIDVIRLVKQ